MSIKFPEDIPWVKTSRRTGVGAISEGCLSKRLLFSAVLIPFILPFIRVGTCAKAGDLVKYLEPRCSRVLQGHYLGQPYKEDAEGCVSRRSLSTAYIRKPHGATQCHNRDNRKTARERDRSKKCPIPLGVSTQVCTPCGHVSYIPFLCLVGSNPEKITDLEPRKR